ncbi:MAG: hypothetical protein GXP49_14450 [Deltaproteobacteria bacterium]|nr:hypothetical protein [Deltaproteobacteria bacterium]
MKNFDDYYKNFSGFERDLLRYSANDNMELEPDQLAVIRYALNLARISSIRVRTKMDLFLEGDMENFKKNLANALGNARSGLLGRAHKLDEKSLKAKIPFIKQEVRNCRNFILEKHSAVLSSKRLDQECGERKLVLALGGDGGSTLAHIGMLEALEEAGIRPAMIVGTGMGALMGLIRARQEAFDFQGILNKLPSGFNLSKIFKKYEGQTKYGLLGVFTLDSKEVGERILATEKGSRIGAMSDLPIPLRVVITGLKLQMRKRAEEAETRIVSATPGKKAIWRRVLVSLATSAAELAEEPSLLEKLVLGGDNVTSEMDALDAVGFGAAIPGVIHYDVYEDDSPTARILDGIFNDRGLYRVCDGVVVDNVPGRTAFEEVQKGVLGTRNAFILACDCFAPRPTKDMLLYPLQVFVRNNAKASMEFADLTLTYSNPPSPFRLLPRLDKLKKIRERSKEDFSEIAESLKLGLKPLPPWDEIEIGRVD